MLLSRTSPVLRFVRVRLKPEARWGYRAFYQGRVVPALQEVDGCLFVGLLEPAAEGDECLSMTIWRSPADSARYEESGLYDRLLDESDPFLATSGTATEWSAEMSGPRVGERSPLPDPDVESHPVLDGRLEGPPPAGIGRLFVRVLEMRVAPGRFAELVTRYRGSVRPALLSTPGCRGAILVEGARGDALALSLTLWDEEADAIRYETSGLFEAFIARLRDLLSSFYEWRLSLAPPGERREVEGRDLDVRGYRVVAGRPVRGGAGTS
jgi:heme-degrading monooxygenase HmoA